ncbi:hypothetical protein ACQ86G_20155 [Roseateles chitinivorans]|uniref:hypothetical protein n=1 Tax=Roseateles chitinivorans TaxID=2917965 RepID=UPI003D6657C6
MKVFAISSPTPSLTPEVINAHMPAEVHDTVRLYLSGKVDQFWFQEKAGPIFLMDVPSLEDARAALNTLPLVASGVMSYELRPVVPLMPLARLIPAK